MKKGCYEIGDKINHIVYMGNDTKSKYSTKCDFMCYCGTMFNTFLQFVKSGHTKSCGCLKKGVANYRHGGYLNNVASSEYKAWQHMKERCYDLKDKAYHNYGGRGISVCDRWLGENGFTNFLNDMGKKPSPKHSLDRFPNNETGNYEPSNCRWATQRQQTRNQRTNRWITYDNKNMILKDWATELNITAATLCKYLKRHSFNDAYDWYNNKMRA